MSQNQELIERLKRIQEDAKFVLEQLAHNENNEKITRNNYESIVLATVENRSITSAVVVRTSFELSEIIDDMLDELDI